MTTEKLTFQNWLTIISLILGILGVTGGVAVQIFATKGDVYSVQMAAEKTNGEAMLAKWRLDTTATRVENLEARQSRMDINLVKVLDRLNVSPAPEPAYKPMPAAPKTDHEDGGSL